MHERNTNGGVGHALLRSRRPGTGGSHPLQVAIALWLLFVPARLMAQELRVYPSTALEVGDEVIFDASEFRAIGTTGGRYEWDFGDGFKMYRGPNPNALCEGGMTVSHFYMAKGSFTAVLTVFGSADATTPLTTASVDLAVAGDAPLPGFELLHADFHGHIAQYVYARVPEALRTKRLLVTLTSTTAGGYSAVLLDKTGLEAEERLLLRNALLPAGSYVLRAEIRDAADTLVTAIKEKLDKPYDGAPRVGIDENNAVRVDGEPFFALTPWIMKNDVAEQWHEAGAINAAFGMGYHVTQNVAAWDDYVATNGRAGIPTIGPAIVTELAEAALPGATGADRRHNARNVGLDVIDAFILATRDDPSLVEWSWHDEPNIGGTCDNLPPPVLRSWVRRGHDLDPQRLEVTNFAGADFYPDYPGSNWGWHKSNINKFSYAGDGTTYKGDAAEFGGRRAFVGDVLAFDIYPLGWNTGLGPLGRPDHGRMETYADALDEVIRWSYGLAPVECNIQPGCYKVGSNELPCITGDQLRMQVWVNIVHGVKGISWFQYHAATPAGNLGVMAEIGDEVADVAPIFLGPPSTHTVSDDANARGRRVDTLVRETDTDVYVFAVRLTEPPIEWSEVPEPESVDVSFELSGVDAASTAAHEITGRWRREWENHGDATTNGTDFAFTLGERRIVPGTVLVGGKTSETGPWSFAIDDGLGALADPSSRIHVTGTVDYDTGDVQVTFGAPVLPGKESLHAVYRPERRDRTVALTDGTLHDTFPRDAVRIYVIPKTAPTERCGNGVCDPEESAATCATDCPDEQDAGGGGDAGGGDESCGDSVCDPDESTATCPIDCPDPQDPGGDGGVDGGGDGGVSGGGDPQGPDDEQSLASTHVGATCMSSPSSNRLVAWMVSALASACMLRRRRLSPPRRTPPT